MIPKIEHPLFEIQIPSSKKKAKFRPMLVKEEKILLMAKEGGNINEILLAIKQVVNNCVVNTDFNIDLLTTFDLEYLFTKIRALSVDTKIQVQYKDVEDEKIRDFEIDLNKVEVKFSDNINKVIELSKTSGIKLKYPTINLYNNSDFRAAENDVEIFQELIHNSLDTFFDDDKFYNFSNFKKEEVQEFIDNLEIKPYRQIEEFLKNIPSLFYEIKYTNDMGKERTIVLDSLNDFFTFI